MYVINILKKREIEDFDRPPLFNSEDRKRFFYLSKAACRILETLRHPTNKLCYILQRGYFRASCKFFNPAYYNQKDVEYILKQLNITLEQVSLSDYTPSSYKRQQKFILEEYGFSEFNQKLRNGQWEEIASDDMMSEKGSTFTLELEDTDTGTSQLISSLKNKKTIEEMVVYEVNPDSEKASYAYYFHKVFVESVRTGIEDGHKVILFDCLCISFRQRTSNNYEPVLWDWNTRTHSYTGSTRI